MTNPSKRKAKNWAFVATTFSPESHLIPYPSHFSPYQQENLGEAIPPYIALASKRFLLSESGHRMSFQLSMIEVVLIYGGIGMGIGIFILMVTATDQTVRSEMFK